MCHPPAHFFPHQQLNDPPSVTQAQCLESYVDDSKATVHFVKSTRLDIEKSPLQETVF